MCRICERMSLIHQIILPVFTVPVVHFLVQIRIFPSPAQNHEYIYYRSVDFDDVCFCSIYRNKNWVSPVTTIRLTRDAIPLLMVKTYVEYNNRFLVQTVV
jgi:hypothetical protein